MSQGLLIVTLSLLSLMAPCSDGTCLDTELPLEEDIHRLPDTLSQTLDTVDRSLDQAPLEDPPGLVPTELLLSKALPAPVSPLILATSHPPAPAPPALALQEPVERSKKPPALASPATGTPLEDQRHAPLEQAAAAQGVPIEDQDPVRVIAALLASLAAIGLYHRLSKRSVLEHATRRRILALLDEAQTLSTTELAERLEVSYRTARHHASKLEAFGLISCVQDRGPQRWALPGNARDWEAPLSEEHQRILDLVADAQGVHLSEIARRLGIAKATAKHRLDALLEDGLLEDQTVGPLRRFFLTEQGEERL